MATNEVVAAREETLLGVGGEQRVVPRPVDRRMVTMWLGLYLGSLFLFGLACFYLLINGHRFALWVCIMVPLTIVSLAPVILIPLICLTLPNPGVWVKRLAFLIGYIISTTATPFILKSPAHAGMYCCWGAMVVSAAKSIDPSDSLGIIWIMTCSFADAIITVAYTGQMSDYWLQLSSFAGVIGFCLFSYLIDNTARDDFITIFATSFRTFLWNFFMVATISSLPEPKPPMLINPPPTPKATPVRPSSLLRHGQSSST